MGCDWYEEFHREYRDGRRAPGLENRKGEGCACEMRRAASTRFCLCGASNGELMLVLWAGRYAESDFLNVGLCAVLFFMMTWRRWTAVEGPRALRDRPPWRCYGPMLTHSRSDGDFPVYTRGESAFSSGHFPNTNC